MEAVERYSQVKSELLSTINSREITAILQIHKPLVRKSIEVMCTHLDSIIAGRTVSVTEEDKKTVMDASIRLLDIFITSRITPTFKNFVRLWLELCNNWNTQVGFISELKTINNTLCLLVDIAVTLEDLVQSATWIIREIKTLSSTKPPGVVVAEDYIRYIHESLKEEDKK